jgi:hypothetical protein
MTSGERPARGRTFADPPRRARDSPKGWRATCATEAEVRPLDGASGGHQGVRIEVGVGCGVGAAAEEEAEAAGGNGSQRPSASAISSSSQRRNTPAPNPSPGPGLAPDLDPLERAIREYV